MKFKRLLGVLLSLAIVLSMVPFATMTALADDGHAVSGAVTDSTSTAVTLSGLTVTLYKISGNQLVDSGCFGTVLQDGTYSINGVPDGSYIALINAGAGYRRAFTNVSVSGADITGAYLTLTPPTGTWDDAYSLVPPLTTGDSYYGYTYHITSAAELAWVAHTANNGYNFDNDTIILENSIDLNGDIYKWVPIANDSSRAFWGTFDGNNDLGYKITGLQITEELTHYAGLFGYVDLADIMNVDLDVRIDSSYSSFEPMGGALVAVANSSTHITSCNVSGTITITSSYYSSAGGLVASLLNNSTISKCSAAVNITGLAYYAGGLVGYATSTVSISNSGASGNVQGTDSTGGFIGLAGSGTSITNCYATGTVNGGAKCGGFAGVNTDSVTCSYSAGTVSGSGTKGGYAGSNTGTISGSYWKAGAAAYGIGDNTASTAAQSISASAMTDNMFATALNAAAGSIIWKQAANINGGCPVLDGVGVGIKPIHTIVFTVDGSTTYSSMKASEFPFSAPAAPAKTDFSFDGWYTAPTDGTKWTASDIPYADMTLYAQYTPNEYTVSGTVSPDILTYPKNDLPVGLYSQTDTSFTNPLYTVTTDSNGHFSISHVVAGSYIAAVLADGDGAYNAATSSAFTVTGGDASGVNLALVVKTYDVSGAITPSITGFSASGLTVRLFAESDTSHTTPLSEINGVNAPGTYTITGVINGSYVAVIADDTNGGYKQSVSDVFTISGADKTDIGITLDVNTYSVSGTVGSLIPGAQLGGLPVRLYAASDTTHLTPLYYGSTDEYGVYSIDGVTNGSYTAVIADDTNGGYEKSVSDSFTVSGADKTGNNITLNVNTYTVSGIVSKGSTDAVVEGVTVNLYSGSDITFQKKLGSGTTDNSGSFTLGTAVPNGGYVAVIAAADGSYDMCIQNIMVSGANVTNANLTLTHTVPSPGGGLSMIGTSPAEVTTSGDTTTAKTKVAASTIANGTAAAAVTTEQLIITAIEAMSEAAEQGTKAEVEISVDTSGSATGVSVTVPKDALEAMSDGGIDALTISSAAVTVTFDATALEKISLSGSGSITISAVTADESLLTGEFKQTIGNRPVYDLTVTSGSTTISSFGGGTATVRIPYTPATNEDTSKLVIYYISISGALIMVPNCQYDASTGMITFTTTHFSTYAVGYNDIKFTDVSGWYADDAYFLAARGIMKGPGSGLFNPGGSITRAELAQLLYTLSGAPAIAKASPFSDVKTTDWYFAAVTWAYDKGIIKGFDGKFNPTAPATRQDIAVMLLSYVENATTLTLPLTGTTTAFKDSSEIAPYALRAVTAMQRAGIISGNNGSFMPQANATRAEAAKMIASLLKNMLESA